LALTPGVAFSFPHQRDKFCGIKTYQFSHPPPCQRAFFFQRKLYFFRYQFVPLPNSLCSPDILPIRSLSVCFSFVTRLSTRDLSYSTTTFPPNPTFRKLLLNKFLWTSLWRQFGYLASPPPYLIVADQTRTNPVHFDKFPLSGSPSVFIPSRQFFFFRTLSAVLSPPSSREPPPETITPFFPNTAPCQRV